MKTETKATTMAAQITEALEMGWPSRWVLRMTTENDVQWAVLIECCPGAAPGSGGCIFQMLREDGSPAHRLREITWEEMDFHVPGEGLITCPTYRIDGLELSLGMLDVTEEEGFSWDGTIYEPARDKLELGVIDWVPHRKDGE